MTQPAYLGIDIAKASFEVALQRGQRVVEASFSNDEAGFAKLGRWLTKQKVSQLHACLAATGRYGEAVAHWLHEAGHRVSVVNPTRIKRYAESRLTRNKTDKLDAQLILDFVRTQQPPAWTPPAPEQRELQELVRRLASLKRMRQQERNRHQSGLLSQAVLGSIAALIAVLDEQIKALEQQIHSHIEAYPALLAQQRLLLSIPGIGALTAASLLGEIPDVRAFASAKQLAAYAGLTPRQQRSGTSLRGKARLSKTGNAALRALLYMPALAALRFNPLIGALKQRLREQGKASMVIVAAAMHKLLHIVYGVLKSGRPFDPYHALKVQIAS